MSESHGVRELGRGGGGVTERNRSVDGGSPFCGVHVLPRPPHAVDLAVMEVKPWVTCSLLAQSFVKLRQGVVPGEVKKSEPGSAPTVK